MTDNRIVTVNNYGGQVNTAIDNATLFVNQFNSISPMERKELEEHICAVKQHLSVLDQENAKEILDAMEKAREELDRPEPRKSMLNSCLNLLAPMITVANGSPVLLDNLQKLVGFIGKLIS